MQSLKLQFIDQDISSWGGISILKNLMDTMCFVEKLESLPLPKQGSNRGYSPTQLIVQFMTSVWCGANRYSHLDIGRFDTTIQKVFGFKTMPEHKTFQRYFNKFSSLNTHKSIFCELYNWFLSKITFNNFTLDVDSSVITRYGKQEASVRGYNPKKPGRPSHHPLIAFVADVEMVANFWLRPGDSHTANNFHAFLEETLSNFGEKKIGLLRLDSGFYSNKTLDYIESDEHKTNYIIAVPMLYPIQRKIANNHEWVPLAHGIEVTEFEYLADDWVKPRRMIAVRQKIKERPDSGGRQLSLFGDILDYCDYRYSCFVTSLELSSAEIWRLYRGRATCENIIKELKYDYGLDKMNESSFDGTEASMVLMTLAYNFMSFFRKFVINEKVKNRLSTLRYKILAIPSLIEKSGETAIINMAVQMNRRTWIQKIWEKSKSINLPCII